MDKRTRLEIGATVVLGIFMVGLLVPVLPVNETYTVDVEQVVHWPHGGTVTYHTKGSYVFNPEFNSIDVRAWLTNPSAFDAHNVVMTLGLQKCNYGQLLPPSYQPKCDEVMEEFNQTVGSIRAGENKTISFGRTFSQYYSKGPLVGVDLVFVNIHAVVTETRTRVAWYDTVAQRTFGSSFNYVVGAALGVLVAIEAYRGHIRHRNSSRLVQLIDSTGIAHKLCMNPTCKTELPIGAKFCDACGTSQD